MHPDSSTRKAKLVYTPIVAPAGLNGAGAQFPALARNIPFAADTYGDPSAMANGFDGYMAWSSTAPTRLRETPPMRRAYLAGA